MARALAPRPKLLLLDEPFGAVDAKVRQRLRADTKKWQRELQIPTILVTHDQREALELGDRVAVMDRGRFAQIDTPSNVYDQPADEFVAQFIGRVNVFQTDLGGRGGKLINRTQFHVMIRPEDIGIDPWNEGQPMDEDRVRGTVVGYAFLGRTGGYVNRCVNDIRRRPSQPLIQWRFHPHTVHRDRRLRSTQGPSDA